MTTQRWNCLFPYRNLQHPEGPHLDYDALSNSIRGTVTKEFNTDVRLTFVELCFLGPPSTIHITLHMDDFRNKNDLVAVVKKAANQIKKDAKLVATEFQDILNSNQFSIGNMVNLQTLMC